MQTLLYSIMHFLVDGACAYAMFAHFYHAQDFYLMILLYNFCAFALQLPIGSLMDFLKEKQSSFRRLQKTDLPLACTFLSLVFLVAGIYLHPVLLGIGNALFHVGGGIGVIHEDRKKNLRGQALGIFVAPGAMGLFLFTTLGKSLASLFPMIAPSFVLLLSAVFFLLFMAVQREKEDSYTSAESAPPIGPAALIAVFLAFLVVILRSYTGFRVSFSWKSGFLFGFLATLAVVLGKAAGGIVSAHFGMGKTILLSLILAALCYFFKDIPAIGIAALFFFNMTMPLTLYMIVSRTVRLPGTSFGLLTLALFLGFLPQYFSLPALPLGRFTGSMLSLISLLLLFAAFLILKKEGRTDGLSS